MNLESRKPKLMNVVAGAALLIGAAFEGLHVSQGERWRGLITGATWPMVVLAAFWALVGAFLIVKRNATDAYVTIGAAILTLFTYGVFLRLGENDGGYVHLLMSIAAATALALRVRFTGTSPIERHFPRTVP